jgi:hypothetical protein
MWKQLATFIIKNWKTILWLTTFIFRRININIKIYRMNKYVEKLIDRIVKLIDEKTNTGIIDPIDQIVFKKLLSTLYVLLTKNADPVLIKGIELLAKSIDTGSDEELIELLTEWVNGEIDLPQLDEVEEGYAIEAILSTIAYTLRALLTK